MIQFRLEVVQIQEEAKHQKEKPLQAVKKDKIMYYIPEGYDFQRAER